MEQIPLSYSFPKEIVTAIMMPYRNTKVKVLSPDGDTAFFDIVVRVLQGYTLALGLLIICLDYILRTLKGLIKEKGKKQTIFRRDYGRCIFVIRSMSFKYLLEEY